MKQRGNPPDNRTAAEQLRDLLLDVLHTSQQRFEEDQVRIAQTLGAVQLRGANVVQIGGNLSTTRPITSSATLLGWALRETAGAAAQINLRDGADAGAPMVVPIGLAANGIDKAWFGPGGLSIQEGLFVETLAGTYIGAVFLRGSE